MPPPSRGANALLLTNMVGVLLLSQCIALNLFENSSTCNNSLLSPQFTPVLRGRKCHLNGRKLGPRLVGSKPVP